MKEKWMAFFRQGSQRAQINTDRVLKNTVSDVQRDYINDQLYTMNDLQLIRSIYILSSSNKLTDVRLKERVSRYLQSNLQNGKFEFKKGNTLIAFAQMANYVFDQLYQNSKDIRLDIYNSTLIHGRSIAFIPTPSLGMQNLEYEVKSRIAKQFVPFYKYYFDYYKSSQKLVAMRFLSNHRVYDETLANNFIQSVNKHKLRNTNKVKDADDAYWIA